MADRGNNSRQLPSIREVVPPEFLPLPRSGPLHTPIVASSAHAVTAERLHCHGNYGSSEVLGIFTGTAFPNGAIHDHRAHARFPSLPYANFGPRLVSLLFAALHPKQAAEPPTNSCMFVHHSDKGSQAQPIVFEVPALLEPVTQIPSKAGIEWTVLVEQRTDLTSGLIATPRLVPHLPSPTQVIARFYRGTFGPVAVKGLGVDAATSKEVMLKNDILSGIDGAYVIYAQQLGKRGSDGRLIPGPVRDCENAWPPPKSVTWRLRLHPTHFRESDHTNDLHVILHCRADLRADAPHFRDLDAHGTLA